MVVEMDKKKVIWEVLFQVKTKIKKANPEFHNKPVTIDHKKVNRKKYQILIILKEIKMVQIQNQKRKKII